MVAFEVRSIRPAGFNERRCIARDTLGLYGRIVAIGTYTSPGELDNDLHNVVTQALQACVSEHPALSVVVQDSGSNTPQVASLSTIKSSEHLEILDDAPSADISSNIEALLDRIHSTPTSDYEARPQWKVYVQSMSSKTVNVAFAASHAFMDGMSLFEFHRTFHKTLAMRVPRNVFGVVDLDGTSQNQLPPALDKAATFPITWRYFGAVLAGEFLPSWVATNLGLKTHEGSWCGSASRPALPPHHELIATSVRILLLRKHVLEAVLSACRSHHSRITALLNHLFATSLALSLRKRGQTFSRFVAETPYDLRRCIPQGKGAMANYVSGISDVIEVVLPPDENDLRTSERDWAFASEMTTRLAGASSTLNDQIMALLKYISNFRDWAIGRATKPAEGSFSISNLGNFGPALSTRPDDAQWSVDGMVFSQSADATSVPLNINVASSGTGSLAMTVTWWPGMLGVDDEDVFVEDVLKDVQQRLERIEGSN